MNQQPTDYKSVALPIELHQHMAGKCRLERQPSESKSDVITFSLLPYMEQVRRLELLIAAWKAAVFPLHHTCRTAEAVILLIVLKPFYNKAYWGF